MRAASVLAFRRVREAVILAAGSGEQRWLTGIRREAREWS